MSFCASHTDEDNIVRDKKKVKSMLKQASSRKRSPQVVDEQAPKLKKKKQPTECFLAKSEEEAGSGEGPKKQKRRRKKKISDIAESGPGTPDDLRKMIQKCLKSKRLAIEMEECSLPDSCFLPVNDLTHTLASYLKESCPKWAKLCKNHSERNSLLMLIVCGSAHRVLELIRLLTSFKGNCRILKLFAKHIKVEEQVKWLRNGINHLGIGTPGRIKTLIEQDAISLDSLKYVIFDWNWRDQKLRRMMDIPEIQQDTITLLESGIIAACRAGSLKLGLF
ncbi:protein CMSS1 isoform X2 [Protopterus annectens]|uniref:protein CMSS1 isoform X2 n=1 Tax=Protopterus annectens TaxID=7888 RepID=UPI001CF95870|nr:protein CMSS1 isoform X2 [Protopterus annectens]